MQLSLCQMCQFSMIYYLHGHGLSKLKYIQLRFHRQISFALNYIAFFRFNSLLDHIIQWYCHSNQGRGCDHNCSILVYHHCSQCPCMLPYFQGYNSSLQLSIRVNRIFFHSDLCVQRTTHSCKLFLFHFNGVILVVALYFFTGDRVASNWRVSYCQQLNDELMQFFLNISLVLVVPLRVSCSEPTMSSAVIL